MVIFACVLKGDYQDRGAEYVNTLLDSVLRNLSDRPFEFWCLTDRPEGLDPRVVTRPLPDNVIGWWSKIYLFSDAFPEGSRIVFLDLDTVICGRIDELYDYAGPFCGIKDPWAPGEFGSSMMLWEAGTLTFLWDEWNRQGCPTQGGDQEWIAAQVSAERWDVKFPGYTVSLKEHCNPYPPKGARVVNCHGRPKPHEAANEFVKKCWVRGGISEFDVDLFCNTRDEKLRINIAHALSLGLPEVTETPANKLSALIVGGGPSLGSSLQSIRYMQKYDGDVFACNQAARYLADQGIVPDYQVIIDARPETAELVSYARENLFASQCDRSAFQVARERGYKVKLFHCYSDDMVALYPDGFSGMTIGGGTTVLTRALCVAYTMGYRDIHLYGADSSYATDRRAYAQSLNDVDETIAVTCPDGAVFQSTAWLIAQANEFQRIATALAALDVTVAVHGNGLLPHVARLMTQQIGT